MMITLYHQAKMLIGF